MNQNPYVSPAASSNPARVASRNRLLWLSAAWLTVCLSLPVAWATIELLNQEYWWFWHRRWQLTNFSYNGSPISADAMIVVLAMLTALLWLSSFGFYLMSRKRIGERDPQEKGGTG